MFTILKKYIIKFCYLFVLVWFFDFIFPLLRFVLKFRVLCIRYYLFSKYSEKILFLISYIFLFYFSFSLNSASNLISPNNNSSFSTLLSNLYDLQYFFLLIINFVMFYIKKLFPSANAEETPAIFSLSNFSDGNFNWFFIAAASGAIILTVSAGLWKYGTKEKKGSNAIIPEPQKKLEGPEPLYVLPDRFTEILRRRAEQEALAEAREQNLRLLKQRLLNLSGEALTQEEIKLMSMDEADLIVNSEAKLLQLAVLKEKQLSLGEEKNKFYYGLDISELKEILLRKKTQVSEIKQMLNTEKIKHRITEMNQRMEMLVSEIKPLELDLFEQEIWHLVKKKISLLIENEGFIRPAKSDYELEQLVVKHLPFLIEMSKCRIEKERRIMLYQAKLASEELEIVVREGAEARDKARRTAETIVENKIFREFNADRDKQAEALKKISKEHELIIANEKEIERLNEEALKYAASFRGRVEAFFEPIMRFLTKWWWWE